MNQRYEYVIPTTKLTTAQETMKLIRMGKDLVIRIRKDTRYALGLERGQIVFITIQKPPELNCRHCGKEP